MAQFVKNYVQDLAQDIQIRHCGTLIFNTDSDSNVINVSLYNGQEEAPQSGSVACAVICSDGSTVPVTGGTISGNTVSVTLGADVADQVLMDAVTEAGYTPKACKAG